MFDSKLRDNFSMVDLFADMKVWRRQIKNQSILLYVGV